jgi:hypothetical protein
VSIQELRTKVEKLEIAVTQTDWRTGGKGVNYALTGPPGIP